ncbi:hypothetical protein ACROYT_G014087 [Oculina patagonica]
MASGIIPYQFEPEHSSSDEIEEEISEAEEEEEEIVRSAPSNAVRRTANTSWCACDVCELMPTEKECVCCKELKFLSKVVKDLSCVTKHSNFEAVCLNRDVLWTALVSLHDRESAGLPDKQEVPNRSFRYAAYRQFTWWVHGHLGKKIRRVIPSCAVNKIRQTFPADDGVYTGYTEEDDSACDSELEQAWKDFLKI